MSNKKLPPNWGLVNCEEDDEAMARQYADRLIAEFDKAFARNPNAFQTQFQDMSAPEDRILNMAVHQLSMVGWDIDFQPFNDTGYDGKGARSGNFTMRAPVNRVAAAS